MRLQWGESGNNCGRGHGECLLPWLLRHVEKGSLPLGKRCDVQRIRILDVAAVQSAVALKLLAMAPMRDDAERAERRVGAGSAATGLRGKHKHRQYSGTGQQLFVSSCSSSVCATWCLPFVVLRESVS
jgi:hypothetical protein